jgi:predicted nucleic acid-binding protein
LSLVVDASVWVAASLLEEPYHKQATGFLAQHQALGTPIFLPRIGVVEIACAIARRVGDAQKATAVARAVVEIPSLVLWDIDETVMAEAVTVGALSRLRGSDAVYAAIAKLSGSSIVTYDEEMLARVAPFVKAVRPGEE